MRFTPSFAARLLGNAAIWLCCGGLGFACSSNDSDREQTTLASLVGASGSANAARSSEGGSAAAMGEGSERAGESSSLDVEPTPLDQDNGEPLGCGLGPGSVDQQQLDATGTIAVSLSQLPGQTFRLGRSGVLAGIEFALTSCGAVDPNASIQLTLSRAGNVIATTSIPASRLPTKTCDGRSLTASELGSGFFDFTGQCVRVSAGETLTATLGIVGSSAYTAQVSESGEAHEIGNEVVNGEADETSDLAFKVFVR